VITCTNGEKAHLANIIEEAVLAFSSPLGDPYTESLVRRKDSTFGCEQMIANHLESLFISLIRRKKDCPDDSMFTEKESNRRRKDEMRLSQICEFMEANVEKDLSSEDIQRQFFISQSSLQKLFQHKVSCGAMQHFQRLKIDRAKEMIREKKYNFSEISERLSFSSIHYFSRRFKAITGMTPSEYASSVRSISGT
jgi:AraC-like DNA-binding protein